MLLQTLIKSINNVRNLLLFYHLVTMKGFVQWNQRLLDPPGRMIGRNDEMEFFLSRWGLVKSGLGSCIIIVGEAGTGKTRLLTEFRAKIKLREGTSILLIRFQRQSITPFSPFVEFLRTNELSPFFGKSQDEIGGILEETDQPALFRTLY